MGTSFGYNPPPLGLSKMAGLTLTLSCGYYDRTLPVLDGQVKPEGIDLRVVSPVIPGTSMGSPEADVYETANPALIVQRDQGQGIFGIPVFPRRKFFHQLLLTRKEEKISSFEDFAGKRVGILRWYQHAMGVWLRGYLKDRHGIDPKEIHWFTERKSLTPLDESRKVTISLVPEGKSLVQMLADGELDILCHEDAHRMLMQFQNLRRVIPNFKEAEVSYFKETGIFPINHVLAIKKEIVEQNPWVVSSLVKAFEEAKRITLDALDKDNSLLSSPWVASLLEEQYHWLKRDMFPYGLEANRKELETHIRYLHDQGLISRPLKLDEIFFDKH